MVPTTSLPRSTTAATTVRRLLTTYSIGAPSRATHHVPSQLRFFASSSHLPHHTAAVQQSGEIVTRLGPSERLPGLQGVFLTRAIKKFHPIEVLPSAATATRSLTLPPPSEQDGAAPDEDAGGEGPTAAPPLVLNLAFAPRHHVSLRRFLALRHMFSSTSYLHAATEHGWYLVAPSAAAPFCADGPGLQRWVRRHHKRYLQPEKRRRPSDGRRRGKGTDVETAEAALESGEELTSAQLRALVEAEKRRKTMRGAEEEGEVDVEADDEDGDNEGVPEDDPRGMSAIASASATAPSPQLRRLPPLIPESHLFEINDGVTWELPPPDDLDNPAYWKTHRRRMTLYESTGDADAAEQREAVLEALRSDPRAASCTEQQLYDAAEVLFQTLKQKANVTVRVEDETGLLTLVPLQDLPAGSELYLHYGREWWTGRLLSSLLLAVPDAEMGQIRWIEQLFGHSADSNQLFPLLVPAHQQRQQHRLAKAKQQRQHQRSSDRAEGEASEAPRTESISAAKGKKGGPLVLYNTVTRAKATDAAVLAFAIRRSCVEERFFSRLVLGDSSRGLRPLFRLSTPDADVPMRALRKALLASLRGGQEEDVDEGDDCGAAQVAGRSTLSLTEGSDEDDDGGVFSV